MCAGIQVNHTTAFNIKVLYQLERIKITFSILHSVPYLAGIPPASTFQYFGGPAVDQNR